MAINLMLSNFQCSRKKKMSLETPVLACNQMNAYRAHLFHATQIILIIWSNIFHQIIVPHMGGLLFYSRFFVLVSVSIQSLLSAIPMFLVMRSWTSWCAFMCLEKNNDRHRLLICALFISSRRRATQCGSWQTVRAARQSAGQTEEEETVIIHKSAGEMIEGLIVNTHWPHNLKPNLISCYYYNVWAWEEKNSC